MTNATLQDPPAQNAHEIVRPDEEECAKPGDLKGQQVSRRNLPAQVLLISLVSTLLLAPLFWQPVIHAGDLSSHVYNAWLAVLIHQGRVPGLWISRQSTNIAFDVALTSLLPIFGAEAAERIAVSAGVLIFFWGAFAFVCAISKRRPWFLAPCLAVLAYGWVFQAGLLNFYISAGLVLLSLAVAWVGSVRDAILASPLIVLAWLAHPVPVGWLIGVVAYVCIAGLSRRLQAGFLLGSLGAMVLLHYFLLSHFVAHWSREQVLWITGADQAVVFGRQYWIIAAATLTSWGILLLRDRSWLAATGGLPVQLLVINAAGILLLPNWIAVSRGSSAFFSLIPQRMSLFSGVLVCAIVGAVRPRKWHSIVFASVATLYFCFLYRDARVIHRVEQKISALVAELPPMARVFVGPEPVLDHGLGFESVLSRLPVLWRINDLPGGRVSLAHVADRVCIGRCFDFGDYEPSTREFRVRALPSTAVVASNPADVASMADGTFIPGESNRPIFQIHPCGPAPDDLCVRLWAKDP